MGNLPFGVSQDAVHLVAEKIRHIHLQGMEIGIVLGGGNIFRGIQQGSSWGLPRSPADQIGMLATLINGITLQQALIQKGCPVVILSAIECPLVGETYQWEKGMRFLKEGKIVLFVGGTGHPYFTTDTAAALRACEIEADLFLKGTTKVDGVYDQDPRQNKHAKKYDQITYKEVLDQRLGILDLTAVTLCMTAAIPIRVFNFLSESLLDAVSEAPIGTIIRG